MSSFRFQYFGELTSPFCILNIFKMNGTDFDALRLAKESSKICQKLKDRDTVCVLYPTPKMVEKVAATHFSFPYTYGMRTFDFIHGFQAEEDITKSLMAFVGGRVHTILTVEAELSRFADNSFDRILVAQLEMDPENPPTPKISILQKQKPGGRTLNMDANNLFT